MGILSLQLTQREEPHRIVPCTIVCIKQTFNKINNLIDWLIDWEVLLLLDNFTLGPAQWCYEYPLVANTHLLKVFNSALKTNKNLLCEVMFFTFYLNLLDIDILWGWIILKWWIHLDRVEISLLVWYLELCPTNRYYFHWHWPRSANRRSYSETDLEADLDLGNRSRDFHVEYSGS